MWSMRSINLCAMYSAHSSEYPFSNNEKIPPEKLELAPLIERIAETKLFLNNDGIPMSKSTLTKMAEKMWQKDKRVRHNEKHKEKSPYRKDRN